jgi:PTH1 family peptidyl-tRNA hydrolase
VQAAMAFYQLVPTDVMVALDDLALPCGKLRIRKGGSSGGHNGLRDITKALGTKEYVRVRVGVGRPPGRMDTADHVLKDFPPSERKDLPMLLDDAADAVEMVLTEGLLAAQGKFHARA